MIREIAHSLLCSLNNRRQYVSADDTFSESLTANCGIPQGSVFGQQFLFCFFKLFLCVLFKRSLLDVQKVQKFFFPPQMIIFVVVVVVIVVVLEKI